MLRLFEEFRLLLFGLVLVVVIIFFPDGIVGGVRRVARLLKQPAARVVADA
jgi:ABC-type branched-subunit amino acid transport system permease subunit